MESNDLQYDKMVENALKEVVKTALRSVAKNGLPGNHHFYITFRTNDDGVEIPEYLKEKYQDEMTIVLQYQFYNLEVTEKQFSVSLSFNNVQENLVIPLAAITGFADPSVKFGLQFHSDMAIDEAELERLELDPAEILSLAEMVEEAATEQESLSDKIAEENNTEQDEGEKVISLDSFRKKSES